ncbi:hypothetical protein CASFOL_017059 [Castilleja foliolosa]|uniref:Uncharacterized protein n=1 Tax=Castilleja foliolosa TaxID=1961234 RepID=A0ABD3DEB4_9LAMI
MNGPLAVAVDLGNRRGGSGRCGYQRRGGCWVANGAMAWVRRRCAASSHGGSRSGGENWVTVVARKGGWFEAAMAGGSARDSSLSSLALSLPFSAEITRGLEWGACISHWSIYLRRSRKLHNIEPKHKEVNEVLYEILIMESEATGHYLWRQDLEDVRVEAFDKSGKVKQWRRLVPGTSLANHNNLCFRLKWS